MIYVYIYVLLLFLSLVHFTLFTSSSFYLLHVIPFCEHASIFLSFFYLSFHLFPITSNAQEYLFIHVGESSPKVCIYKVELFGWILCIFSNIRYCSPNGKQLLSAMYASFFHILANTCHFQTLKFLSAWWVSLLAIFHICQLSTWNVASLHCVICVENHQILKI